MLEDYKIDIFLKQCLRENFCKKIVPQEQTSLLHLVNIKVSMANLRHLYDQVREYEIEGVDYSIRYTKIFLALKFVLWPQIFFFWFKIFALEKN